MHAEAAIKFGADELLTLDDSGFASLTEPLLAGCGALEQPSA
jgi:hypothetical protein